MSFSSSSIVISSSSQFVCDENDSDFIRNNVDGDAEADCGNDDGDNIDDNGGSCRLRC